MFYVIGGAPRCGKTTLAKKLSERIGVPWVSTDTLESIVAGYVAREQFDSLFPKNLMRRKTNQSNDEMYASYTSEEIIKVYITQEESLERAILTFMECEAKYNHEFILEGHHIHPGLVVKLQEEFDIKSIFLGRDSVPETIDAITNYPNAVNDWVTTKTNNSETYTKIAEMLVDFSQYFKKSAEENGLDYVSVEDNFTETIEELVMRLSTS